MITAVTPCLNDAAHLPEMIESFLAQRYPNKELFVQDGGSTDGTHDILRRYPIRWTSARDCGPHDALNKAILASRGDVIVIMPANDRFVPGAFSRAAAVLEARPDADLVYGDCEILDEHGAVARLERPGPLEIDRLFWSHWLFFQSAYIRRQMFARVGLFDSAIQGPGDTEWLLRMVEVYPPESMLYVPEVWSCFRLGQSYQGAQFRDCKQNARVLLAAHERFLAAAANRRRLRQGEGRARAGMHCQAAFWYARAGRRSEAWRHYFAALRQWPGLALTRVGVGYGAKVLLGRKAGETCSRLALKVRQARRQLLGEPAVVARPEVS
jgi:glycosyltransferase involved in cell wall biosynthesis